MLTVFWMWAYNTELSTLFWKGTWGGNSFYSFNGLEALRMAASLGKLMILRKFRQVQKKNIQILMLLVQWCCFFFVVALFMPSSNKQKRKEKKNLSIWNPPNLKRWLVYCSLQQPTTAAASFCCWTGKPLLPYTVAFILNSRFHVLWGFKAREVSVLQIPH